MSKLQWDKWYWEDVDRDCAVLSNSAYGGWVRILAHTRNSAGSMTLPLDGWMKVLRTTQGETISILSEIIDLGICDSNVTKSVTQGVTQALRVTESNRFSNGYITVTCRRQARQHKDITSNAIRQQRYRDRHAKAENNNASIMREKQKQKQSNAPPIPPEGDSGEAVISIPLAGGKEFHVTQAMKAEFQKLYPGIDVMQSLRAARGWCLANPARSKTLSGCPRFLNSWLAGDQNNGRNRAIEPGPKPQQARVDWDATGARYESSPLAAKAGGGS